MRSRAWGIRVCHGEGPEGSGPACEDSAVDVLADVDEIPWATLNHCFGASDDIPGLLRETAAGSEEALEKLDGYMVHQEIGRAHV